MSEEADKFFMHYGVLGMHWGRRKDMPTVSNPMTRSISKDAAVAKSAGSKIKSEGLDALDNKELQTYLTRMNLEQQYSKLTPTKTVPGKKFAQDLLAGSIKNVAAQYIQTGLKKGVEAGVKFALSRSK